LARLALASPGRSDLCFGQGGTFLVVRGEERFHFTAERRIGATFIEVGAPFVRGPFESFGEHAFYLLPAFGSHCVASLFNSCIGNTPLEPA
jgi:hypothetical protein